ncbi:hypothetical protein BT93_J1614 [Corymbia citriodora subsp. variegata]|nr:hypothetical protein BT93_J1614 [Corymbia citriodora subsp. variegata]
MALQEQLNKFKKQREKCQSTLTSIAARAGGMSTPAKPMLAPPAGARAPLPAVKFSDGTERLKYITGIRKAPVQAQMKCVIDLLYEKSLAPINGINLSHLNLYLLFCFVLLLFLCCPFMSALTPEQIYKACYVAMLSNKAVSDSLANNPEVHYDGQRFSYKSRHDVKDKNYYMEGIKVVDLKDAYPTVMEDLQALKAAGQVWLLSNFDSREDIAYLNDPKVPLKVDDDVKQLFRCIELHWDMIDIKKDLHKNELKPSTNTVQRRLAAQTHGISQKPKLKKKKHEISKRTKL